MSKIKYAEEVEYVKIGDVVSIPLKDGFYRLPANRNGYIVRDNIGNCIYVTNSELNKAMNIRNEKNKRQTG